jgi:hypothetical protein
MSITVSEPYEEAIRRRAYAIYEHRLRTGRKGDALSDWLEAEAGLGPPEESTPIPPPD